MTTSAFPFPLFSVLSLSSFHPPQALFPSAASEPHPGAGVAPPQPPFALASLLHPLLPSPLSHPLAELSHPDVDSPHAPLVGWSSFENLSQADIASAGGSKRGADSAADVFATADFPHLLESLSWMVLLDVTEGAPNIGVSLVSEAEFADEGGAPHESLRLCFPCERDALPVSNDLRLPNFYETITI